MLLELNMKKWIRNLIIKRRMATKQRIKEIKNNPNYLKESLKRGREVIKKIDKIELNIIKLSRKITSSL